MLFLDAHTFHLGQRGAGVSRLRLLKPVLLLFNVHRNLLDILLDSRFCFNGFREGDLCF